MSLTPQDNARSSFNQGPGRHVFQVQTNLSTPQQAQGQQQQRTAFQRPTQGGIRPPGMSSPYATPYTQGLAQAAAPRQNGSVGVSAEQQIAQGVLNSASGSGSNTPQHRLQHASMHASPHGTPQVQSANVSNAISQTAAASLNRDFAAAQRQSQNASPAQQVLANGRPSMNGSPANSNLGALAQDGSAGAASQDLTMIDPQLGAGLQMNDPNASMLHQPSAPLQPAPQGEMLCPPPVGTYPTFETLYAAAQAHALAHGYAFVIGRSKRDNRGLKKVFLICDRGGVNKEKVPGEQRQRKTKSRKCGCEFGVYGIESKTAWTLRGRMDGEHLAHNHPPSENQTEHPGARKLDPKAIAAVKALEQNGVSVKETLEILHRENPNVRFLPRDIYNARAAIKRDPARVEATATEALPTFYKKPQLSFEEKLRAELRTEVANAHTEVERTKEAWRTEVEDLKKQLEQKDKMIQKFEMFIDICNERVMVQRERLEGEPSGSASG